MDVTKLLYGLFITALGMGIVFCVLIFLRYLIAFMKVIFAPNKKNTAEAVKVIDKPEAAPVVAQKETTVDNDELIAVITAAVVACLGSRSDLVVKSITRVGDSAPIWARTGRHEQMLNRL